jgi:hypothetical protein
MEKTGRDDGTNGNNGTIGENQRKFPFVPFVPFVPSSLLPLTTKSGTVRKLR